MALVIVPEWSKGSDLRSDVHTYARVRTPPMTTFLKLYLIQHTFIYNLHKIYHMLYNREFHELQEILKYDNTI